jgi:hypothetical protein
MNIFFLSTNPEEAAKQHCDKHVVKMILETAQLLFTCHWIVNPEGLPSNAYKKVHANHPCGIWVRESLSNYKWLCELGEWLCKEYTFRYGKIHKTQAHIEWLKENPPVSLKDIGLTPIRQAMPDEYKDENPVKAYQTYYIENKLKIRGIVRYTKRERPSFLPQDV